MFLGCSEEIGNYAHKENADRMYNIHVDSYKRNVLLNEIVFW